jgi:hypothetical protein
MSGIGLPKVDARGRSGPRKVNPAMKIEGQFIPRGADMLASPAFRALSLSGHRVLARIEIEHMGHGGADNGALPVTFQNFEDYGIHRHAIRPAIYECVALGFLAVTERGRSGNGDYRRANKFRLTYLPMRGVKPTHDWRRIESDEQARELALAARGEKPPARSLRRARGVAPPRPHTLRDIESSAETAPQTTPYSGAVSAPKLRLVGAETATGKRRKPPLAFQISDDISGILAVPA